MSDPRCGTYAGYNAHIARSQTPCDACRKAASEYSAEWRRKNPAARDRNRAAVRLRSRALTILGQRHPTELRSIIADLRRADH